MSDSEHETIEGEVEPSDANWGKAKYDYYYTDYVDKDYPTKLTAKEERLAALEQEEALRIQKKLLSTIDLVSNQQIFNDVICPDEDDNDNLLAQIENQNRSIEENIQRNRQLKNKTMKKVTFKSKSTGNEDEFEAEFDDDDDDEVSNEEDDKEAELETDKARQRRPINLAMKKNRGLTPYKKKEYRNPRVKHKIKYKKAISKRRRIVQEAKPELQRYSGEAAGIKTSTIKSIKLC